MNNLSKKRKKIGVINSHPIQYFAPLYKHLNSSGQLNITCLYCSNIGMRGEVDPDFNVKLKWDIDLLSGYNYKFMGSRASKRTPRGFWSLIVPEVWLEIRNGDYDAIWLHGYNFAVSWIALFAAKSKGIPVFLRGETHLELKKTAVTKCLHNYILKHVFRIIDGFLVIGTKNREYYESLGVGSDKLYDVPYTVDNDRFIKDSEISRDEGKLIKSKYNIPENIPIILFASKFMKRKHPEQVLEAANILQKKGYRFSVLMIGSGEMESELKNLVKDYRLENVVFGGFINQSELPKIYGVSDIFVLPSESEPWGLIVNEVMCSGKPIIVGNEVGCAQDLVQDGVNGYRVNVQNTVQIADAIEKYLSEPEKIHEMGKKSYEIIKDWNYERCNTGLIQALNKCVN